MKYNTLLEGLEISIVKWSYVNTNNDIFRIDSNYFKKEYLLDEGILKKSKFNILKNLLNSIRSFGAYSLNNYVEYKETGIPFIRGVNIKKGKVSFDNMIFIDETANSLLWKSAVKPENILLSMSGTIGDVAIASKNWDYPINSNQDIAKIDVKGKINPYYIFAFLYSKFGQNYMQREARGSVQQHVYLSQIEGFIIPLVSSTFQGRIESILKSSESKEERSKKAYEQAKSLLLEHLGLEDFQPSKENINIKSFKNSFLNSGRLDAEFYQKKYEELEKKIKGYKYGYEKLSAFIDNYSTGYPYKSKSYIKENGIPLIRINNILKGSLDLSNAVQVPKEDIDLNSNDIALENDILISMSGTIGNSCKIPTGIKAVVNQRIMRITPKGFDNEVLPLLINSAIGEMQLNQIGTGGVQTNISSFDIKNILIPKIIEIKQQEITKLINQSFVLKKQSELLLQIAKDVVEIAIEKDEKKAENYIKIKLDELKINL